ncbi:MAG: glucose-1-phosphate thymidylyltransferase, partial [Phaeodactylibacter sp.]|nr:glucose-1-phosphate thymidylyltransferase [Phaeodactylibacter sp.]
MRNIILFDSESRNRLLPFTFIRPVGELRIGILTIREKWERWLGGKVSYITQDYLSDKYPIRIEKENYLINASALPSVQLVKLVEQLELNEAL